MMRLSRAHDERYQAHDEPGLVYLPRRLAGQSLARLGLPTIAQRSESALVLLVQKAWRTLSQLNESVKVYVNIKNAGPETAPTY